MGQAPWQTLTVFSHENGNPVYVCVFWFLLFFFYFNFYGPCVWAQIIALPLNYTPYLLYKINVIVLIRVSVSVWECVQVSVGALRGRKAWNSRELELHGVVSCPMRGLGTELRSPVTAASTLNCSAISIAPLLIYRQNLTVQPSFVAGAGSLYLPSAQRRGTHCLTRP